MQNTVQLLVVVTLACGLVSCTGQRPTSASASAPSQDAARPVAVARVIRTDLSRNLELAAEFRPWQEIDLHAKVSGYVRAIHVDVGDRVQRGQLIAELEAPEMAQELTQAEATIKRTEIEVERARSELRRAEINLKLRETSFNRLTSVMKARPKLIAQQELDDVTAHYREAEAQYSSAKAVLAASEEQVRVMAASKSRLDTMSSYLRMTAPFTGVITRRLADPGSMVQAGTASHIQALPVVRLSQVDHLRLVLPVPESIAGKVRVGAPVEVRVDSLNRVFQGRVARTTGTLEPATRTMETEVDIANPGRKIMPGMYGYASLRLDQRHDALAVPVQALSGHGVAASVMLVKDQKLEERQIKAGLETPNFVEVMAGLEEGDQVVIGNRSQLRAGMAVTPKLIEAALPARAH